jgi:hypothetical protein
MQQQPWIGKPLTDLLFILLPPFLCLGVVLLFPDLFQNTTGIPDAAWVVLILLVDVAHVYSTLYRTYFDKTVFRKQQTILLSIPFIGFVAGVLLYSVSSLVFWRVLAYVAIFHFIRQQYGFMRVYSRKEKQQKWFSRLDTVTIYAATLYPVLYWHLSGPRNFNWFIERDLLYFQSAYLLEGLTLLYYGIIGAWVAKEMHRYFSAGTFNLPRLLIMTGTLVSWYFGIVYYNGDMAFTLLNVVSHGVPYMALVWLYGKKHYTRAGEQNRFLSLIFSRYGLILFLGCLFLFAFIEEGLWDFTVWQEHRNLFPALGNGEWIIPEKVLAFIVPLLALPQVTHYILDGFIWKIKQDDFRWNNEVKPADSPVSEGKSTVGG